MWDQFKKKINDFLFVEIEETEEVNEQPTRKIDHRNHQKDNIKAKITYQYPEKKPFRFPVIPDRPKQERTEDIPAYARKKERHISGTNYRKKERHFQETNARKEERQIPERYGRQRERHIPKTNTRKMERHIPESNIQKKEYRQPEKQRKKENDFYSKKPFEPTPVPSPIYGFHDRWKERENNPISSHQPEIQETENTQQAEAVTDTTNTYSEEMEDKTKPLQKPAVAEEHGTDEGVYPNTEYEADTSRALNQEAENEAAATQDITTVTENKEEEAPLKPVQKSKPAGKQHKIRPDRKKDRGKNTGQKPLPFNVMMSANDKRRHHERKIRRDPKPAAELKPKTIPYHLLNDPVNKTDQDQIWMREMQELLEKTLKHFNVRAKVVNTTQGPSVTRFEVQPEMGVKVSKVKNLSDDLKLNMAAKDIRIEAPIPGKNTIGIEIPNRNPQLVGLQEIFESDSFRHNNSHLTVGLGLSIEGSPLITDIQKMPHGLIAGATGSGKSVCINTILISLLYKASHKDVKFMLIDPKMVELAPYNGIPHLISPVITDVKAATAALKWAVNEMEERYDKFVTEGVRDVERYNKKMVSQNRIEEKLPYMVIVIDELADLMMVSPQDVEDAICRIAQKARACGIHLLLATQRPSVDVITGLIKANIPTRIAFSVSSQVDSRTIMDTNGAEKLLGKGDMLFVENGAGKSIRLQGAFVSDEEIERVTDFARNIAEPEYAFEQEQLLEQISHDDHEDELLQEAIGFVVRQNSASTSLLQRHFKIGYNRAARLMDSMESRGIIAQQNGSKPREVLISEAQIE
ncbi:DNA translocase FtsK [Virgibacillus siamensis]|uniref:DNA translocase FtsK n=1 Tax=Virgibacillus siamensis TaxID=480071 RepID=UPI000985122B|nr:DNA translocase FtsK [Virgibacillus siamensis]